MGGTFYDEFRSYSVPCFFFIDAASTGLLKVVCVDKENSITTFPVFVVQRIGFMVRASVLAKVYRVSCFEARLVFFSSVGLGDGDGVRVSCCNHTIARIRCVFYETVRSIAKYASQ